MLGCLWPRALILSPFMLLQLGSRSKLCPVVVFILRIFRSWLSDSLLCQKDWMIADHQEWQFSSSIHEFPGFMASLVLWVVNWPCLPVYAELPCRCWWAAALPSTHPKELKGPLSQERERHREKRGKKEVAFSSKCL